MFILLGCLFLSTISLPHISPLPDSFFPNHPISRPLPNPPGIFPAGWSDLYSRAGIRNHPILSPFPPNVNLVNDTLSLIYSNFSPTFPEVFNDTKLIDEIYRRQKEAEDSLLSSVADLPILRDEEITAKDTDNAETAVEGVVYNNQGKESRNEDARGNKKSKQEDNTNERKESSNFENEGKEKENEYGKGSTESNEESSINPQPKWIDSSEDTVRQNEDNPMKHDEMQSSKPAEIKTTKSERSHKDVNTSTKKMDEVQPDATAFFTTEQIREVIYKKEVKEMSDGQEEEDTNHEERKNPNQGGEAAPDMKDGKPDGEMHHEETDEQMEGGMMSTIPSTIKEDEKKIKETDSNKKVEDISGKTSTITSDIDKGKEETNGNKEEEDTNQKEDSINRKETDNGNLDDEEPNPVMKDKEINVRTTWKIIENRKTITSTSRDETKKTEMNLQEGDKTKKEMDPLEENNEIIQRNKETQILPEANPGDLLNSDLDVVHNDNGTNVACSPNGTNCWSTSKSILMTTGILIGIIVGLVTIVGLMTGLSVYTFHHWKLKRRSRARRSCSINNVERAFTPTPYTSRRPLYENEGMFQDNDSPINTLEAITVENYRENAI